MTCRRSLLIEVFGWEDGDGTMGMGQWGWEHGDGSVGLGTFFLLFLNSSHNLSVSFYPA